MSDKSKIRFRFWVKGSSSLLLLFLFVGAAFPVESGARREGGSGPIHVSSQSPIQLLFLQPVPDRAAVVPQGHGSTRLSTTLTNTLVSKESAHGDATVDMEVVRTSLEATYGMTPRLELGFSFPVAHYYSGFLDDFILDVERTVGDTREIRAEQDANTFTHLVHKDSKAMISGSENATGTGDLVVRAKAKLREPGDLLPMLSMRAAIKLPTGDKDRAFGSGEPDWGLGVLLEKEVAELALYVNADVTFPGQAFDDLGLSLREFYTLLMGVEYRFRPQLSFMSQIYYLTRPFENTGVEVLDGRIWELLIGVNYQTKGDVYIQAGMMEDIFDSCDASADVTFFLSVGVDF